MRMPPDDDKAALLRLYRYNLAPENTVNTRTGGYASEKLPEAHIAGAVPIYYGDAVRDGGFWNPARVLTLDDTELSAGIGIGPAELIARIKRLETDAAFRAAFFSEPVLAQTAAAWLEAWFEAGAGLVRAALAAHPVLRNRFLLRPPRITTPQEC